MTTVRPGLCSVTLRGLPVDDVIDIAAENRLHGIEWGGDVHVPPGAFDVAERVATRCRAAGLECPSYGSYLQPDATDEDVELVCRTARALGATNVRVWTPFGAASADVDPQLRATIAAGLASIADRAATHGLTVGIEFHGWTLTDTASSAAALVAEAGSPNLFSYWQPIYWNDGLLDDPAGQLAEFELVLPHLAHLHVYWWRLADRFPLAVGEAVVRPALERAAAKAGWSSDRYAFIEFVEGDDPAALSRDALTLRSWLEPDR